LINDVAIKKEVVAAPVVPRLSDISNFVSRPTPKAAAAAVGKLERLRTMQDFTGACDTREEYKDSDVRKIMQYFSHELVSFYLAESCRPMLFLKNHGITAALRAKMVDWMIEVLTSYKCSEQTFFMAVRVMDTFLASTLK
jgi:hypothetical protein